jgi:adenylate kinase
MKIIFLGGQGSGKSTQAKQLGEKLNLPTFEMGELLRRRSKDSDSIGTKIKAALDVGYLVPDEITINLLRENTTKASQGYVLDGFPRNTIQLDALDNDITKVYYINVSDSESVKRLALRKREDDTEEVLAKRLEIYHQETEPLLEEFKKRGILDEVDGERSIGEIHQDILERVQKLQSKQNV